MTNSKRKVAIITGTRAEWGLLSPIARRLRERPDVELSIIATNMHLMERYGHTVDAIRSEGFDVAAEVPMEAATDSPADTAAATALCMSGMAEAFNRLQPDVAVVLGDRYELLAVASAATIMRIPLVHLHGGEISEGAIDDSIRHAITKLAALHLTSAEPHRRRVIQMGEDPLMVHNIGAIGVSNAMAIEPLSPEQLKEDLGIEVDNRTLVVTYHPVTADDRDPAELFGELLEALDRFPESTVIFTYPNNDARGSAIIDLINDYCHRNPGRAVASASLGVKRYMSALRHSGACVGNSSSGIIEAPSLDIPTVDIGTRQQGRLAADSVIHCGDSADVIASAIAKALSPDCREAVRRTVNPYYQPDTAEKAAALIAETPLEAMRHKKFHDLLKLD